MRPEVVFFSNGPGEVAGWLSPVLHCLSSDSSPRPRVTVVVPPCDFASGRETGLIESQFEVDQVVEPRKYLRSLLVGPRASGLTFESRRGVVVHLGGDHFQSGLMARRLGFKAIAYTEGRIHHRHLFQLIATDYVESRDRLIRAGVPEGQVVVIGNLMVDAVAVHCERSSFARSVGLDLSRPVIGLLPGSRPKWLDLTLGLFFATADLLASSNSGVQFVLPLAPTITWQDVVTAAERLGASHVLGGTGNHSFDNRWGHIITSSGTNIAVGASNRYDIMNCIDVAVTLPGTNTMELAALGVPMVVAVPLNEPEKIPLEGLPGLIGGIPIVGPLIKSMAVRKLAARTAFASLPNRRAAERVIPEVIGRLTPSDISGPVEELLRSPSERERVSVRLKGIAGPPGAAKRLAKLIADQLACSDNTW